MRTAEETQKLVNAARLEEKLQRPENKLNALRLLQALTVKEVYEAKRRLGSIEARFCELREASAGEAGRSERIEKQLDELRKDKEGLQLLISGAEAATHNTKDSLESLRAKVSDEYFKLTADNARFGKDIKTLNKQFDRHQEQIRTVEDALNDFRSKLPKSQEIADLNNTLARLEPMVKSMYDKLDRMSMLTLDQKAAFAEAANNQAQIRTFLDAIIPRQEEFLQFLEKLPDASALAASSDSLLKSTEHEVNSSQLSNPIPLGPQPPVKAVQMLEQYNHFSNSYRIKRPKSDARFIRQYLKKIDHKAAWLIQLKLQQEYPDLVEPLQRAEVSNKSDVMITIDIGRLRWEHIKIIMRRIDTNELFNLLEDRQKELNVSMLSAMVETIIS